MKKIILYFVLLCGISILAQDKYYTKSGEIIFESSVPTFEEVKAKNDKVTAILKDNGEIAALALVKGFRFKIALMEEHFNENYIESEKYSKASFSGNISNFSIANLTTQNNSYQVKGKLNLHGVTKEILVTAEINKANEKIIFNSNFEVTPEDFNIEIPSIVRNKIAQKVAVSLRFEMQKK